MKIRIIFPAFICTLGGRVIIQYLRRGMTIYSTAEIGKSTPRLSRTRYCVRDLYKGAAEPR